MRLICFAIYLGIGAILHAAIIGSAFDWSSAWTFAWLFAWPIMLCITFGAMMIAAAIVCVIIWMAWSWLETIAYWRERRRKQRGVS